MEPETVRGEVGVAGEAGGGGGGRAESFPPGSLWEGPSWTVKSHLDTLSEQKGN